MKTSVLRIPVLAASLLGAALTLANRVQAQFAWSVYNDSTGGLVTANAYTGGDAFSGSSVTFTIPANTAYDFATSNFGTTTSSPGFTLGTGQLAAQATFTTTVSGGLNNAVGSAPVLGYSFLANTGSVQNSATPGYYNTIVNNGAHYLYLAGGTGYKAYMGATASSGAYSGGLGSSGGNVTAPGNGSYGTATLLTGGTVPAGTPLLNLFQVDDVSGSLAMGTNSSYPRLGVLTTTATSFGAISTSTGVGRYCSAASGEPLTLNQFVIGFNNTTTSAVTLTLSGLFINLETANTGSVIQSLVTANLPFIQTQPANVTNNPNTAIGLSVTAVGSPSITGYQWYANTTNSTVGGTAISGSTDAFGNTVSGATTASLSFPGGIANAGSYYYYAVITNSLGSTTSGVSAVTILAPSPISFVTPLPQGVTQFAGTTVTLTANVVGTTPVTWQWFFNGTALTDGTGGDGSVVSGSSSATGLASTLTIAHATAAEAGTYYATASNTYNGGTPAQSANAVVSIVTIPGQTASPVINEGGTATFSVTEAGDSATYQWYLNGSALSDGGSVSGSSTSTLILSNAQGGVSALGTPSGQAGTYTVRVTTPSGSVTTTASPFLLTVEDTGLSISNAFPAASASAIPVDAPVQLTFSSPVALGTQGTVKIWRASDNALIDTIDVGALSTAPNLTPAQNQAAYGINAVTDTRTMQGQLFSYFPIIVNGGSVQTVLASGTANATTVVGTSAYGSSVQIQWHNYLAYNTQYYITIDPGVFDDSTGAFSGVSGAGTLTFSTKAAAPTTGANPLHVAADGSGDFCTVQGVFDFLPANNTTPTTVLIKAGTYDELVFEHGVNNVTLQGTGSSRDAVWLECLNNNNLDGAGGSYYHRGAIELYSSNLTVENLMVENLTEHGGSQAEGLILQGTQNIVTQCDMLSYQDTFLSNNTAGSTYISDCHISGDTDFIWGSGADFFTHCEITERTAGGYYTQIRNAQVSGTTNHGDVFTNCTLDAANSGVTGCYLARIDPTSGNFPFSEVCYINCTLGTVFGGTYVDDLNSAGWLLNNASTAPTVNYWYSGLLSAAGGAYSQSWTSLAPPTSANGLTNGATLANYETPSYILNNWTPQLSPTFLSQPASSTSVAAAGSLTLTVLASGVPEPTYQWTVNGSALSDGTLGDGAVISGSATGTLTITNVTAAEAGIYAAVASNGVSPNATSAAAVVNVTGTSAAAAVVTQPVGGTFLAGSNPSLSVVATGDPVPTYQWFLNSSSISGATSSTLTLSGLSVGQQGTYKVVVSNTAGSVTSAGASVVLGAAPVLTQQPNSRVLPTGASTNWQAYATGNPGVSYAWTLNGTPISGATSFVYTVSSASGTDAGTYQVIATNSLGSASSSTWTLTVGVPPTITTQPSTQYVLSGGTVNLSVVASSGAGILPVTGYQWTLDGAPLSNGGNISGATSSTLTIANVTVGSNPYQVNVISAAGGVTSGGASVVVGTAPVLTQQPNSRVVVAGATTSWQAYATGNPGVSYAWTLNGTPISGATSFVYTVSSASGTNAGTYQVTATNVLGSASSSTWTLTVGSAPTITTQPSTQYVLSGGTVNLSVVASSGAGILPVTGYQWTLDGAPLSNGGNISGATSSTLTIANVTVGSNPYQVNVISAAGGVTSGGASVVVGTAPVLTQQPNSRKLSSGGSTSWQAYASGNPGISYVWTLNGTPISGATSFVYTVSSASSTDAGTYQVTATNAVGSAVSATWTLTVGAAPTIATQPAAVTADSGSTVSLSVGAGAVDAWPGTTSYQWLVNGTAINGATSATYSIGYVSQANSGNYSVQLTDVVGSVTSNSANVHVLAPVIAWSLGQVGTGAQGVISTTFTIPAGPSRTVLVAGLGPILGVGGVVSNPQIDLYNSTSVDVLTATGMATFNGNPGYQATTISAAHLHCAISLTVSSLDSEGLITLAPGSYTAVLSGAGATTGLGELAVYDLSNQAFTNTETTTQAPVVSPSGPLTEKFLVAGASSDTVIVAALGPGLTNKGITSPLSDPELTVSDQNSNVVGTDTGTASGNSAVSGPELSDLGYTVESGDSGVALTLAPGVYTAVSASASGSNSGVTEIDVLQQ